MGSGSNIEAFWGHSATFWVAIEAIGVCANTIFVGLTLLFIYRQLRTATTSVRLDAIRSLQDLVDNFRNDRGALYANCPLELALSHEQFPRKPPARHWVTRLNANDVQRMALSRDQLTALQSISPELKEKARNVIDRLNDIGQLVEDGFVDRHVFFGKYHVLVIQCCHLVEAIRREEEAKRGGAYGQRLLRMRHRATIYNDIWPKHRAAAITITQVTASPIIVNRDSSNPILAKRRVIYESPAPTLVRRLMWVLRRWLSLY